MQKKEQSIGDILNYSSKESPNELVKFELNDDFLDMAEELMGKPLS